MESKSGKPEADEDEDKDVRGHVAAPPEGSEEQATETEPWAEEASPADEEEKGTPSPRVGGFPVWAIVLIAIAAALITYSALRIAGEQHYQSCVGAVQTRYGTANDPLTRLVRQRAITNCSSSPF